MHGEACVMARRSAASQTQAGARRGRGFGAGSDASLGDSPSPTPASPSGSDDDGEGHGHCEGAGPAVSADELVDALAGAEADEGLALAEDDGHEARADVCPEPDGVWGTCWVTKS